MHASLGTTGLHHVPGFVAIEPLSNVAALPKADTASSHRKGLCAGLPTMVVYARFVAWAIERVHFPMPEDVTARFEVSRATAHRWLNLLAEAYGVERPRRAANGDFIQQDRDDD
ncbi:hypothetical protein [Luteimonas fraxinea]|uniref:Helix-turn-helix domain-containing protein n=1 Tax=Luteimonas fraxinea TaxID=2901869 RepID=A0ABS8UEB0_9GAMM|nr:hypothetical protein [Luteimonas fraxinea]MCD9097081.1 hypothetical protein [Luteimonas fraxinea]